MVFFLLNFEIWPCPIDDIDRETPVLMREYSIQAKTHTNIQIVL